MARTPLAGRLEKIAAEVGGGYTRRDALKRAGAVTGAAVAAGATRWAPIAKRRHCPANRGGWRRARRPDRHLPAQASRLRGPALRGADRSRRRALLERHLPWVESDLRARRRADRPEPP